MKWNVKVWAPPKILSCQFFHQKIGTFDRKKKHQNKMKCQGMSSFQKFWVVNFFSKKLVLSIEKVKAISNILCIVKFNLFWSYLVHILFSTEMNHYCKRTYCLQKKSRWSCQFFFIMTRKISYFRMQKQLNNFDTKKWNEMSRYELLKKFWVVNFFTKKLVLSIEK